jgi:chemotaxis protein methyltransferase CheR
MEIPDEEITLFSNAIKENSQYDFSDYTIKSFRRRLEKVLTDNNTNMTGIIAKIKNNPAFLEKTVKDITVNTTEMFRDPKVWHALRYSVFNKLKEKEKLNIWHAGVSSGQELYSMLILLFELGLFERTTIVGTDLNTDVLEDAKKGVYKYRFNLEYLDNFNKVMRENPYNIEEKFDVPYSRYLDIDKTNDTISIKKFLLNKPVYMKHDLVQDGNIFDTPFDLIICRNVLIYFNNNLQNKVFDLFYNALSPGGFLIIGLHESILGPMAGKFNKKGLLYERKEPEI